ncbi:MAG: type II toxin-antitoxin system VapB family antitoxin [Planctomycetes bacterium]|nr:type II toxin-antitoxin system VapB family antitoxin [Planctomycetota bacterium]
MATNLELNDRLILKAKRLGNHRTKKEAVNAALESYVQHLGQLKILKLFGTIDFNPNYDYKAARHRKKR